MKDASMAVVDELTGAEILWSDEFYDGPVDGVARHDQQDFWFCVDHSTKWIEHRPRRYLAYQLTGDELARVHDVQVSDQAARGGPRATRALGASWGCGDDLGHAPADRAPVGWFLL